MPNQELLQTICTTKKVRLMQRRAAIRLPANRQTFYPPTGERRHDLWWEAMVMRLQPARIALVVGRRFEVGTLLEVEIADPSGTGAHTLIVQVNEIKCQETGGYVVHAVYLPLLPADILERLQ
jgi:hypothetical protein